MNTDAAEALQALCPMTASDARKVLERTGKLPPGWEIIRRLRGQDLPACKDHYVTWVYATAGFDNHDIIHRKPILTEAP